MPARLATIGLLIAIAGSEGAQDAVTEVAEVTARLGEAPLPAVGRPAINLSPDQIAGMLCLERLSGTAAGVATLTTAHEAALRAREVRRRAFAGLAGEAEMAVAELARQGAIAPLRLTQREDAFPTGVRGGLWIDGVRYRRVNENGRSVLIVEAAAHNRTRQRVELPPVTLGAIDTNGFSLGAQTTQLDALFIPPGESLPFTLRFKSPPDYTAKVVAVFAPPFGLRPFHGCDFPDFATVKPVETGGLQSASLRVLPADSAPQYTVRELAIMELWARRDAEATFDRELPCDQPGNRTWRNTLILADRLSEAVAATGALEEIRRDAAKGIFTAEDIAAAEAARVRTVRAAMTARLAIRPTPPAFRGLSVQDYQARVMNGETFEVSGWMKSTTAERAYLPVIRVVGLDRFDFPVAEWVYSPIRRTGNPAFSFAFKAPAELVRKVQVDAAC